ncbi:phosphotransferase family protein [Candidatus Poriferisocius sp.]|uniref:phosphotransferase family protein n=1 Tax=Candidatus Poriferisocius sp. TaxID=3101276 RepID=UPI003B529945
MDHIRGIQHDAVSAWFEANVLGVALPLTFDLIAGGHSNLTFKVADANGRCYVLRRPPLYQVLATAHDMGREHKIIAALEDTDVPVPRTFGLCEDESVNERPFYVMDFVNGMVVRNRRNAVSLALEQRRVASQSIAETLALIHAVDVDEVGLGDLGRKEDYIARQLRRWLRQFEESKTQDRPQIQEVHDHLVARIPDQGEAGIVHGDYRLDNCILSEQGQVVAVLDWELCTLGDRNADVAQLLVYWAEPNDLEVALDDPPTAESGFASRAEMFDLYLEASGREIDSFDFYMAFGYWKLACILEGVYSRYVGGAMGDKAPPQGAESFVARVDALVDMATSAAEQVA